MSNACEHGSEKTTCSFSEGCTAQSALKTLKPPHFCNPFSTGDQLSDHVGDAHVLSKQGKAGMGSLGAKYPKDAMNLEPASPGSCSNNKRGI